MSKTRVLASALMDSARGFKDSPDIAGAKKVTENISILQAHLNTCIKNIQAAPVGKKLGKAAQVSVDSLLGEPNAPKAKSPSEVEELICGLEEDSRTYNSGNTKANAIKLLASLRGAVLKLDKIKRTLGLYKGGEPKPTILDAIAKIYTPTGE